MKRTLILAAACLAASLAQAAPPIPLDQLQLRVTYRPCDAFSLAGNSMYNPRFFDGSVFAPQINIYCWGSFPRGSSVPSAAVLEATRQTRMVSPIPGTSYLLASGGSLVPFTRYNLDGTNPVDSPSFPDGEKAESFDWVDDNTIICNDYGSNKKRLYLVDVTTTTGPDTLTLTKNTTWCADGWTNTPVSTRVRDVRVGQTDTNFAYYGDNQVTDNPKVYAIDLRSGESTELGHWEGTLKPWYGSHQPGGAWTGSYGLWTVVERGGYLYLQSSDDGIQVYSMTGPTAMGAMVASYSPEQLQAITGGGDVPYYGFDVAANGEGFILGDFVGDVFELQRRAPALSGGWQHRGTIRLCDILGQTQNTTYNPRFFDNNIYVTQINSANYRCIGNFDGASLAYQGGCIPAHDHRMFGRLRGPGGATYLMGSGGSNGDADPGPETFAFDFTRYETWGGNPATANSIDNQVVETFDWVDDDTMISTCYMSGQRKKLYLTDVTVDPFTLTRNTTWCADGWTNTPVSTRIRNVRVGQTYTGYAYYGDAGNDNNPKFYAINLATGASTELGSAGPLHHVNLSWGLWTVVERGNYLYVQTTDDGIQVYGPMINATNKGPLFATYTKAELDTLTGRVDNDQYYGMDLSSDAGKMLLGGPLGSVYVLEREFEVNISKSGSNVILSWPSYYAGAVVESSPTSQPGSFTDHNPQPAKVALGDRVTATVSIALDAPTFFRLRR
jgi:hypothetical protein